MTATATTKSRAERMIEELHAEAGHTRRVLERIPEDRLHWRPHPRSMSIGELAMHTAQLPWGITMLVESLDTDMPEVPRTMPASSAALLEAHAHGVDYAATRIAEWGDAGLAETWRLHMGGQVVVENERGDVLRAILFNQTCHHRGQLTVYLRLLDIPVPAIYGPSADENPFATPS